MSEKRENDLVSGRSQVKVQQLPIGVVFTICCLAGGLLIFIGGQFNSKLLALLGPILLMLGYWALVRSANTGMPLSVIGDSYYYMGFIFTMFSLVITLLSLSNNDGVNINSVVGSFGSALLTTIAGLIMRLATTSFSVQTKEKTKKLEAEIERSLLAFSSQLETLTSEVSSSLTRVHSETQKVLLDSANGYRKVQEELANSFQNSMKKDQERISNSMQELSNKISSIDVQPDIISKPIEAALSDLIESLNEQNNTYKEITKDVVKTNKTLSTQLSKSGTFIQTHMENLDAGLEKSLKTQLTSYETSVNQISTSIMTSLGSFTDIKLEAEEQIQKQVVALSSSLKEINNEMVSVREPVLAFVTSMNEGISQFSLNVDKLNESSTTMHSSLKIIDGNHKCLTEMSSVMDSFNVSVSKFNTELNESVNNSKNANEILSDSVSSVKNSSDQMLSDINNVYGELATQIKGLRD
jgi:hypothetical protein